jgi:putative ABC transport system substrate-binding protein
MRHRIAAVLLVMVALLTSLGWTGESWAQAKIARVGILSFGAGTTEGAFRQFFEPFRRTLADQGWIEGQNVSFEFRNAPGDPPRFAEAAAELVRLKVDVIWAPSAPAVRAAYAATRTIPIVANDATTDPVAAGYVESYGRPGGNVTGVFLDAPGFAGKWLELLKAMVPGFSRVAVLWDPSPGPTHLRALESIARSVGVQLQVLEVRKPEDIDRAFSAFRGWPQALIILPSPMMYGQSERLAELALKHRLPATSMFRVFAEAGGAVAYGHEIASMTERGAVLVAKILGGAKPAELPVERPSKFELVVNLKTTKALGLTVPDSVLVRADEVIR